MHLTSMSPLSSELVVCAPSDDMVDFQPQKTATSLALTLGDLKLVDPEETDSETDEASQTGHHFDHLKNIESPIITRTRSSGSILKQRGGTEFLCTKRSSYKALPVPDIKKIQQEASLINGAPSRSLSTGSLKRSRASVSFQQIHMRMYDQTIGDHPNTSYGPPIALDWNFEECETIPIDAYEEKRGPRRNMRQMMMNYYTRKNTLMWAYGFSEEDIKKASRATSKVQFQRGVTKYFLPISKVEDFVESAGRKAKRVVRPRSTSV